MLPYRLLPMIVILCLAGFDCRQIASPLPVSPETETAAPSPEGWRTLNSSVERRIMRFVYKENSYEMLVFRLNQKSIRWNLSYNKDGKRLEDAHQEQGAFLTINGSYFTEEFFPTGLFADNGEVIAKQAYKPEESGTLVIENGQARLVTEAIDPARLSKNADVLQSFPMLVLDGNANVSEDSGKIARRTAIAVDQDGRFLIIIVDQTALSLFTFASLLAESDLELVQALNLDGGPSTGLVYSDNSFSESYLPLLPLPIVLSVLPAAPVAQNGR